MNDIIAYILGAFSLICLIAVTIDIINKLRKEEKEIGASDYVVIALLFPFIVIMYIIRIRYVKKEDIYLYKDELAKGVIEKNLTYMTFKKDIKYIKVYDRDDYVSFYTHIYPSLGLYLKTKFIDSSYISIHKNLLVKCINTKEQVKSSVGINKFSL